MTSSQSLPMRQYSVESKTREYVKEYGFLSFSRKYGKQILDTVSLQTASKKVVHKSCEFLGNKIADTIIKSNDDKIMKPDENSRNIEKIIILPEKREEVLNKLRQILQWI